MSAEMNKTPSAERVHIAFFGRRNAGKSSLVNAVTGQEISIVSDTLGTTTDPVTKAMELLPLGPVVIIDTPGIDDFGEIGELRVKRALRILNKTDIAVLVVDGTGEKGEYERELEEAFVKKSIPYVTVYTKSDVKKRDVLGEREISVSSTTLESINELREMLGGLVNTKDSARRIIGDRLSASDVVVLVTPIDSSAPKGRMILPQVQTLRDVLDSNAICVFTQPEELQTTLDNLKNPPRLVITDSQVFGKVKSIVPDSIPLTSFSILMAAYKGILEGAVNGAAAIDRLKSGSRVLISEGCTHHRQCEDIGSVKLPRWIKSHAGTDDITFELSSGGEFPESLEKYDLIIHCGGCMLNEREVAYRAKCASDAGTPMTNYGTAIAYMNGILKRSLSPFPELYERLK